MYGRTFLLTGDMVAAQERKALEHIKEKGGWGSEVIAGGAITNANASGYHVIGDMFEMDRHQLDVLKIAHHGSRYSTTEAWLHFWKPRMAVISVGTYNNYGHPHPFTLSRLERYQAEVYRTDRDGEIQFLVLKDGQLEMRAKNKL
jgi:competence protein ComEC